jgi:uncharacterized membrane protein YoaK (UPF0700 family)
VGWRPAAEAGLLCLIAGWADVVGYLALDRIFAANMTGNTVLLPLALLQGAWEQAAAHALALGAFLSGAVAAAFAVRWSALVGPPLAVEAVILVALGLLDVRAPAAIGLLAFAMGVQGAAIARFGGVTLNSVAITGNLLKLADGIANLAGLTVRREPADLPIWTTALTWFAYFLGAAFGVVAWKGLEHRSFLAPAALAIVAIVIAGRTGPDAADRWRPSKARARQGR